MNSRFCGNDDFLTKPSINQKQKATKEICLKKQHLLDSV